jgi:hypothetical protein
MREMELAPLHWALREGRLEDAVREAAALLGARGGSRAKEPPVPAAAASDGVPPAARAIERLVAQHRPEFARGRWIYEWLVDRVWPDGDLVALMLDQPARRPTATNGAQPAALLQDDRFLRAIGANEHDGVTWFNRERFGHAIDVLRLPRAAELRAAAKKASYRVDALETLLAAKATTGTKPTTKPRPVAKPTATRRKLGAKSPAKPEAKATAETETKAEGKAPVKPAQKRITSRK